MSDFFASAGDPPWDENTGKPTVAFFGNALQVWSIMQEHPREEYRLAGRRAPTVADAAKAFNCPPAMVIEAVLNHYWMFLAVEGAGNFGGDPQHAAEDLTECLKLDPTKLRIEHEGE